MTASHALTVMKNYRLTRRWPFIRRRILDCGLTIGATWKDGALRTEGHLTPTGSPPFVVFDRTLTPDEIAQIMQAAREDGWIE